MRRHNDPLVWSNRCVPSSTSEENRIGDTERKRKEGARYDERAY
jgi:hypothetical protein